MELFFLLLASFVTVTLVAALALFLGSRLSRSHVETLRRALFTLLPLLAAVSLIKILIDKFTTVSDGISIFAAVVLSLMLALATLILPLVQRESIKAFLKRAAILTCVLFLLESFVFNFKSFTVNSNNESLDLSTVTIVNADKITKNEDGSLVISGNGSFKFTVNSEHITALSFKCEGEDNWFQSTVSIKDDNFKNAFKSVSKKYASAVDGYTDLSFKPYSTLYEVSVAFSGVDSPITLTSLDLHQSLPFSFSNLRFFTLEILLLAFIAVCTFKLYKIHYDRSSVKHRIAILLTLVLCISMLFTMYDQSDEPIKYPDEGLSMKGQNPYVQMFDAFYNGRLHLDLPVSDKLLEMENPYDLSLRQAAGVSYSWDRAYYDGHYYSYYGATPLVTYYMPYHLLTGNIPSINSASIFFGALAIIFFFGTVLAFVKRFIRQPNLLLLLSVLTAGCFLSGIYYSVDFSDFYNLPGVSSTCFLFMSLFCGFAGCNRKKMRERLPLLALSGIALALTVGARPTKALSALILAPVFIGILIERGTSLKKKCASAASFLLPVMAGAGVIMLYNLYRFDSPFEFGANYQLTVNNVQANSLSLSAIPYAFMHYFLQPLRFLSEFPYVQSASQTFSSYGHYVYADFATGALAFPMTFGAVCIFPFLLRYEGKMQIKEERTEQRLKHATLISALVIALLVAWLDFCMAGIIFSYVLDIMPLITLLSIFVLLDSEKHLRAVTAVGNKATFIFSTLALSTVFVYILLLISFFNRALPSSFYFALEDMLCFWN